MNLKDLIEKAIQRRAREMAWQKLSLKEQKKLLKLARKEEMDYLAKKAKEETKKVNAAMNDPSYISILKVFFGEK